MPDHQKLIVSFFVRLFFFFLVWIAVFFLPAGTFAFWEAWSVLAFLFLPMIVGFAYWIRNDPELLERRAKTQEPEAEQRLIIRLLALFFVATFLIPGFDRRFGWSDVPVFVVILSDLLFLLGYGLCFLVVRENRFASRTIEVALDQPVISSGPYRLVRHPMYLGVLLMSLSLPLALGSYWALIPACAIVPVLMARIRNEESVLMRELAGYDVYVRETRYRLIPGVW